MIDRFAIKEISCWLGLWRGWQGKSVAEGRLAGSRAHNPKQIGDIRTCKHGAINVGLKEKALS